MRHGPPELDYSDPRIARPSYPNMLVELPQTLQSRRRRPAHTPPPRPLQLLVPSSAGTRSLSVLPTALVPPSTHGPLPSHAHADFCAPPGPSSPHARILHNRAALSSPFPSLLCASRVLPAALANRNDDSACVNRAHTSSYMGLSARTRRVHVFPVSLPSPPVRGLERTHIAIAPQRGTGHNARTYPQRTLRAPTPPLTAREALSTIVVARSTARHGIARLQSVSVASIGRR
ncbi:hypothetical protein DFH06DRAFT_1480751 [Mycena polygramma]|nr:hypothetical protein DFH06DRAFT_1480751 [Mycena polygramma]